jgi:hypothetical protein
MAADRPCPILQYADDTLIIMRAEREEVVPQTTARPILGRHWAEDQLQQKYNGAPGSVRRTPEHSRLQSKTNC